MKYIPAEHKCGHVIAVCLVGSDRGRLEWIKRNKICPLCELKLTITNDTILPQETEIQEKEEKEAG